jgi:predicted RNase H-like HicB family nuclease
MRETMTFTAQIEQDTESGFYVGFIPNLPSAHTQAETLDELKKNLTEVVLLCLEELSEDEVQSCKSKYIGTQQVTITF